eukprot:2184106-Rhodomonas_salina.3
MPKDLTRQKLYQRAVRVHSHRRSQLFIAQQPKGLLSRSGDGAAEESCGGGGAVCFSERRERISLAPAVWMSEPGMASVE